MDYLALAELLFPHITAQPADLEARFPARALPDGACVTRFAPSPTGFLHFGALYGSLIDMLLARQTGGRFLLRIEDTDDKRTVENGDALLIDGLADFDIVFDEGAVASGDNGAYGPYRQQQRRGIYQACAKQLVREGKAYPCFCTEDELAAKREQQSAQKANIGYFGQWATCRDLDLVTIQQKLTDSQPWVLRLRSTGNAANSVAFHDLIKGDIKFPENEQDIVLLKSDGIPTYHFAHAVDDHFMRVTHVVRGDEWLASLPVHVQLFDQLGFELPQYAHTATIMKISEDGGKRKLSKRKDPEADVRYFKAAGYPKQAVLEYLMTLLNSDYEEWRAAHPTADAADFDFRVEKLSPSGALFDFAKLTDVSKNVVAAMDAETVFNHVAAWAREFDPAFAANLTADPTKSQAMLSIGRGGDKPRKDFAIWSEVPRYLSFFFDDSYAITDPLSAKLTPAQQRQVLETYANQFSLTVDAQQWFGQVKTIAAPLNFATDNKAYKQNPDAYAGNTGDFVMVLRVAVCGRQNAPDLYSVMTILGEEHVKARLLAAAEALA